MLENFGEETFRVLSRNQYSREDIDWIGNFDFQIEEGWFWTLANNTNYDPGYGLVEIPTDLIIMMKDGNYFERRQYDGAEWWHLVRFPHRPQVYRNFAYDKFINNDYQTNLAWYCESVDNALPEM